MEENCRVVILQPKGFPGRALTERFRIDENGEHWVTVAGPEGREVPGALRSVHTGAAMDHKAGTDPARPQDIVRKGYDLISYRYRDDEGARNVGYREWLKDFVPLLSPGARVLDLGCGNGIPVTRTLAEQFSVTGVDISPVQIERARTLVPGAEFLLADVRDLHFQPETFNAIVAFFSIIHVPVDDQPALFGRIRQWLRPDGYLLATVGHQAWTGTREDWYDTPMYWSHADAATYHQLFRGLTMSILQSSTIRLGDDPIRDWYTLITARALS